MQSTLRNTLIDVTYIQVITPPLMPSFSPNPDPYSLHQVSEMAYVSSEDEPEPEPDPVPVVVRRPPEPTPITKTRSLAECRVVALGRVFEAFDSSGNGILTKDDLARLRKSPKHEKGSWTPTGRNAGLLKKLDRNGNGRVSLPEFVSYFNGAMSHEERLSLSLSLSLFPNSNRNGRLFETEIRAFEEAGEIDRLERGAEPIRGDYATDKAALQKENPQAAYTHEASTVKEDPPSKLDWDRDKAPTEEARRLQSIEEKLARVEKENEQLKKQAQEVASRQAMMASPPPMGDQRGRGREGLEPKNLDEVRYRHHVCCIMIVCVREYDVSHGSR